MARPRSDQKRKAIIEAAIEVFAERGVANSPSSAISSAAGVAEGTLFRYFKTKDGLISELYRELRREVDKEMVDYPYTADPHTRLRYIWDRYLNMAMRFPKRLKVLRQLRASGRLLKDAEAPNLALTELMQTTRDTAQLGQIQNAPAELLVLLFRAHAEATAEFIGAHRELESESRELGFKLFWRGLSGLQ